jgi:O-antigen/teichoic acid export membrane protein
MTSARASVRDRVLRGVGAGTLGPIGTMLIQVISVPVFLHFWGARAYGEWLILSAVPMYLALSDLGFGNVCGNEMTIRVAAGDRAGALRVYSAAWLVTGILAASFAVAVAIAVWLLPLHRWFNLTLTPPRQTAEILLLLSFYVLLNTPYGCLQAGFKCSGQYPAGTLSVNLGRLAENLGATMVVVTGAGPVWVAAALVLLRLGGLMVAWTVLRRRSPWLRNDLHQARVSSVRHLLRPAIAFQAFPAGDAISLQGTVVAIGSILGPVAVVSFSTMRTLTRLVLQPMGVIKHAVWPEISAAFGAQDYRLARKLHSYACQAAAGMAVAAAAVLYLAGPWVYGVWIHHKLPLQPATFHWLLAVVIANSFWFMSSIVSIACNAHERVALVYLSGTAASLALACVLMPRVGLAGAAIALLLTDVLTGWYVVRTSLRLVQDGFSSFARSLFSVPGALAPRRAASVAVGESNRA